MNILFVGSDPTLLKEGSPAFVRMQGYADILAHDGGELSILTRAVHDAEVRSGPLHIYGIGGSRIQALRTMRTRARELVREKDIAVVSAQDPFEHGWVAVHAVRGSKAKLHLQIHTDFLSPWFARGWNRLALLNTVRLRIAHKVLPLAHGIRVVSERIRESLVECYGASVVPATVLPIAVSSDETTASPFPPLPFSRVLLIVGRLEAEKRGMDAITVLAVLGDEYSDVGLVMVGDGSKRGALERYAAAQDVSDRVVFLGPRADARGLMKSADIFLQTSAYEGYGITLIEAALAHTPIVTTDVGIIGDVLHAEDEVLTAPVGDVATLAVQVRRLLSEPEKGSALSEKAYTAARTHLAQTDSSARAIMEDITRLV